MIYKQFFDFDDAKYRELFCVTLYKVIQGYPDLKYLHKLLELKNIQVEIFIDELKKCYSHIKKDKLLKTLNRSPHQLKSKAYLWPYYSLYFSLELYSKKIKIDKDIEKIIYLVFLYHYSYELCIQNDTDNLLYKLEQLALSLTRVIEILYSIKVKASEEVYKKYFDTYNNDLFLHFLEVVDETETKRYKIKQKKSKNYIRYYENTKDYFNVEVTRILHQTENIVDTIVSHYDMYIDFISGNLDISRQREKVEKIRLVSKNKEDSDEVEQKLFHTINDIPRVLSNNRAELIEQISKELLVQRDSKEAGNLFRQRLQNRAYSANVTKQNLISTKHYDIPPLSLLKEFISDLFIEVPTKDEEVFVIVFIFGVLTGQSYYRVIRILLEDFDDIKIKLDKEEMRTKINKNLFSKVQDKDFFEKKVSDVYFSIPYLLSLALTKIQKIINQDKQYYLSDDREQKYYTYFKEKMKLFYKTIHINIKGIDFLSRAYLTQQGYENISTMFCTAIYSQNDTAKMAYASINKKTDYFSDYIQYLYEALDVENVLGSYLNIKMRSSHTTIVKERTYAGSNLLVKKEKVVSFFSKLNDLIYYESDQYKKFNFISIYVRYAMSLLVGTRTFEDSANMKDVSHSLKVMKLSEKAETKLSGLRIIPLCDEILELILYYQQSCEKFDLDNTKFHLFINEQFLLLSRERVERHQLVDDDIMKFVKNVPLNFGRHVFTKFAIEQGIAQDYIDAFLGHYSAGLEQVGIYSSLDIPMYIEAIRETTSKLASLYGVKML